MAERSVTFAVPFVKGKGRARFVRQTGRTFTPDATALAMEDVRMAYASAANGAMAPKGVPVSVYVVTSRPMPKSRPKRTRSEHDVFKPDADNIAKLVLDALNGTAWDDDTQVTGLTVRKSDRTRASREETLVIVRWEEAA